MVRFRRKRKPSHTRDTSDPTEKTLQLHHAPPFLEGARDEVGRSAFGQVVLSGIRFQWTAKDAFEDALTTAFMCLLLRLKRFISTQQRDTDKQ